MYVRKGILNGSIKLRVYDNTKCHIPESSIKIEGLSFKKHLFNFTCIGKNCENLF